MINSRAGKLASITAAAALGVVGMAGTASAAQEATPFRVCSPLGCAQQVVEGTAEVIAGRTRLNITATDNAAGASLSVRLLLRSSANTSISTFVVNDSTHNVAMYAAFAATSLTVYACASPGTCNSGTYPLP